MNTQMVVLQQTPGAKGFTLSKYLEAPKVNVLIAAAPNPPTRPLVLAQWRAELRVSEVLALEARDLRLDTGQSATATPPAPLWVAPQVLATAGKWPFQSCPYNAR